MRLALVFAVLAPPAFAAFPNDCVRAISNGNEKDATRYAEGILSTSFPYCEEAARRGEQCPLHHTSKEYRYSSAAQRFFLTEDREAADAAARVKAEEKRLAREEQERAEAERMAEEEQARKVELERQSKLRELAAAQKAFRENLDVQRLGVACRNLYAGSPDETITNRLCFDYFFKNGLPE